MRFADYDITPSPLPNDGLMFADLVAKGRSGHLGHALVEYAPGCVLAFYSNCSGVRNDGHNGFGWMEYRRSLDAGKLRLRRAATRVLAGKGKACYTDNLV